MKKFSLIPFSLLKQYIISYFLIMTPIYNKLLNQRISVAYGLDNKYVYPTLISMVSILENSSKNTFSFVQIIDWILASIIAVFI